MAAREELFSAPEDDGVVMTWWERFLAERDLPAAANVRNPIGRSWRRCVGADVDHRRDRAPPPVPGDEFESIRQSCLELIDASAPVMASARHFLQETGTVMVLADPAGLILSLEGDISLRGATENIHLVPGANWSEFTCGTNAIGTAIETGQPIQIHSNEHFCAGIKHWSCSAAVLRDPCDGSIIGAIDVSGLRRSYSRHSMALVVATAARIESRLAQIEMDIRYRLLEASMNRLTATSTDGVVVFDRHGRAIKANADVAAMLRDLGATREEAARGLAAMNFDWRRDTSRPLRLQPWFRQEWLTPIHEGAERLGAVMIVPGHHARHVKPRRPTVPAEERRDRSAFGRIVGRDPALADVVERARRVATSVAPVLLLGESGVGKEVFARSLHDASKVASGPFVALNCGGLSRDLLTSELFGYAEGSFTGARKGGMCGKVEAAHGGTLFLDEIGEMPLDFQPLFLRVLEEREVCRIGETRARKVDFRLVTATNRDLRKEVEAGRFRLDLYYRVSVVGITVPALRDRRGDIPELAEHFVRQMVEKHGTPPIGISPAVIDRLMRYDWPGNIRELRNVIESMVLTAAGPELAPRDLPPDITSRIEEHFGGIAPSPAGLSAIERAERDALLTMIRACRGNLTATARSAGLAKSTVYAKIRKFGLDGALTGSRS
ncbi:sigma-54-dependent Fis family transcriptional regulator [Zavarzinia sp.]|uniref:sigma-54-dependent Fis family transcriptional regulator n=1 Tax=Zavarzinia sp. TaxID=2027920 RepID=UPI003BB58DF9